MQPTRTRSFRLLACLQHPGPLLEGLVLVVSAKQLVPPHKGGGVVPIEVHVMEVMETGSWLRGAMVIGQCDGGVGDQWLVCTMAAETCWASWLSTVRCWLPSDISVCVCTGVFGRAGQLVSVLYTQSCMVSLSSHTVPTPAPSGAPNTNTCSHSDPTSSTYLDANARCLETVLGGQNLAGGTILTA